MATYSNIYIDQGSTYSSVIDVKDGNGLPFNLTGYSSRGQIRKSYSSRTAIIFATSINAPTQGKVGISLTAGQTSAMKPGRYIYDVEIYNTGGHVVRISEGQVEINPGITDDNGGIVLPPVQSLNEIIDEKIDNRTVVIDKFLPLSLEEEEKFYSNTKLNDRLVLKAPLNSPTFTGTVSGITKSMVGLANVDNTTDANKPVSIAQQTALNLKANLASPTFTGTPFAPNPGLASNDTRIATTKFVNDKISILAPLDSPTFTGTPFAPNPGLASNDTRIATTKFVNDKIDIFVDKQTNQTISGVKTFNDQIVLQNSDNQLFLRHGSTGNTILITVPANIVANRTYTIPDVGESGAFAMTVGPQTLGGQKTFSLSPIVPTTPTLGTHATSKSYVDSTRTLISGKTLYVDAVTGTDTRTGLNKYDLFKPFATIAAAVTASATGDTVYIRAGSYVVSSQINLNNKGHLYFESGTTVSVASNITAFAYSQSNPVIPPLYIKGDADFVLLGGTAGILTMPSGVATTAVSFECNSISGPNTVSGTLFNCTTGVLSVDATAIQMTTMFDTSGATVFNITGSGKVTARVLFVYCGRFLNGAGGANPGGAAVAQINADVWTLVTYDATAGMTISRVTTNFRIVNYNSILGVGVAFSWDEDTTIEAHTFKGIAWSSSGQPNITIASTAGTTANKIIKLRDSNVMLYSSTNSISSSVPINIQTINTFAQKPATPNVTFKVGSFTVDIDLQ